MAITGTGTEQDPWIVHSYDEIQTASQLTNESSETYMKLANDIDCNTYTLSFEWETVNLGVSDTNIKHFDLDGHTIKNIKVKASNHLFYLPGLSSLKASIHNGKLLNIFLQDAQSGISGVSTAKLSQLSMSFNATGVVGRPLNECYCEECAIYVESEKINSGVFYRQYTTAMFLNCDIKLKIDNLNGNRVFETSSGNFNTYFSGCRITGTLKGQGYGEHMFGYGYAKGCVFNIDTSTVTGTASIIRSPSTGVINTDISANTNLGGLTAVTSAEITNGDALRAKGFSVTNVVGD